MATAANDFEWTKNLACGSCYKILGQLLQFDAARVSFEKAGSMKMNKLTFWPLSDNDPAMKEMSAQLLTQSYIPLLAKNYILKPQNNSKWKDVRRAMQAVLVDEKKSVAELAGAVDELIKFEDE